MDIVIKALKNLFDIVSSDNVAGVYFALSSSVVSITIFAAEFLNSSKTAIEKRMLLKEIPVIDLLVAVLITFSLFFLKNYYCDFYSVSLFISLFIYFAEVTSVVLAFAVIGYTIPLITNTIKYEKCMYNFIIKTSNQIEKEYKKKIKKEINEEYYKQFKVEYIDDDYFDIMNEYEAIVSRSNALITDIKKDINKYDQVVKIKLKKVIGEYHKKGDILGYYKREKNTLKIETDDVFDFDNKYIPKVDKYSEIFDYLFDIDKFKSKIDDDNKISDYYDFLCKNQYQEASELLCDRISDIYHNKRKEILSLEKFAYFINRIKNIAIHYDGFASYCFLQNVTLAYFYNQIENNKDIEGQIPSLLLYRLLNLRDKYKFYDYTMGSLLNVCYCLLKNGKYEEVSDLLKHHFNVLGFRDKDKNINKINFCFIIGIFKGLYYQYFHNLINDDDINKITDTIKNYYYIYDGSEAVDYYLDIIRNGTRTKQEYDFCYSKLGKRKYGYSDDNLSDIDLLLIFLDKMDTVSYLNNKLNKQTGNRLDYVYYEEMKKSLEKGSVTNNKKEVKFENINENSKSEFGNYLIMMIDKYKKIEDDYIINTKIDDSMMDTFVEFLNDYGMSPIRILTFLKGKNLIKYKKIDNSISQSFKKLIPRELFFEDIFHLNQHADNVNFDYFDFIAEKYCDYLKNNFTAIITEKEKQTNKYIYFVDLMSYNKMLYSNSEDTDLSNYIPSNHIEETISVPIEQLPSIYFDDEFSSKRYIKDRNIIFNDLSIDDKCRENNVNDANSSHYLKKYVLATFKVKIDIH